VSIIKQIYEEMMFDTKESRFNQELERSIHKISEQMEYGDEEVKEYMEDLFFEASGCGQKEGFWSGFRFAVVLMAECFV